MVLGGLIMKDFCILTFALGLMSGAYIVSKSTQAQNMVLNGAKAVKKQIKKLSK